MDGVLQQCRRAGVVVVKEWNLKKNYIYIFCVLPHLESASLGRVEHKEALEEVLAVGGHVEGDAIFSSENTFSQLLQEGEAGGQREK